MSLFKLGEFTSHSGLLLPFKIECDALTDEDWECLAWMAQRILLPFSEVVGIPQGGLKLAAAMEKYKSSLTSTRTLIVDDVWTTGRSMADEFRRADRYQPDYRNIIGCVAFARGEPSWWCEAIFHMDIRRGL